MRWEQLAAGLENGDVLIMSKFYHLHLDAALPVRYQIEVSASCASPPFTARPHVRFEQETR